MQTVPWTATITLCCGWAGRQVTVECLSDDGRTPAGILSCSAFESGSALVCGTPCIEWAAAKTAGLERRAPGAAGISRGSGDSARGHGLRSPIPVASA